METVTASSHKEQPRDAPRVGKRRLLWRRMVLLLGLAAVLGAGSWYLGWQRPRELRRQALAHAGRGAEYDQAGNLPLALREYIASTRLDPTNAHAWYLLGMAARAQDPGGSLASLARAARLAPGNALFQREYGKSLLDQGDVDQACLYLARAVQLSPEDAVAHVELGRAYLRRAASPAEHEQGLAELQTALSLQPGDVQTRYRLARTLYQTNRLKEARRELDTTLALLALGARRRPGLMDGRTTHSVAWFGLVKSCHHYLSQIGYRTARTAEAERHRRTFDRMAEYVDATDALFRRLSLDPGDAEAKRKLASVYVRFGFPAAGPDGSAAARTWIPDE